MLSTEPSTPHNWQYIIQCTELTRVKITYFSRYKNVFVCSIIFVTIWHSYLKPFLEEDKGLFILHSQYLGLDIKHLVYMPVGHMVLKIYVPCKNFHVPSQYLYKPCKAYV